MVTIEIKGTQFVNKGSELMHHAIIQKMQKTFPEAIVAMAPDFLNAPFHKRAVLGHSQKLWYDFYGVQFGYWGALIPKRLRSMYGVVLDKEIDVVLDASGFAYTDQFGDSNTIKLSNACKRWKRQGTHLILLPQALGPFTTSKIKRAIKTIVDHADLIFARDKISYEHLISVVGQRSNIQIAPDFTNLVQGIPPDDIQTLANRICVIPNDRMIEKTSSHESQAYFNFLTTCIEYIHKKGGIPFILIHESSKDLLLAQSVIKKLGINIPIINETDPLKVKGIIGSCHATIGSRFHGLVSALSQGVPSIATGWSHKYKMLFDDYNFSEGLINKIDSQVEIIEKIDLLLNEKSYLEIKHKLDSKSKEIKNLTRKMWQDVIRSMMKKKSIRKYYRPDDAIKS